MKINGIAKLADCLKPYSVQLFESTKPDYDNNFRLQLLDYMKKLSASPRIIDKLDENEEFNLVSMMLEYLKNRPYKYTPILDSLIENLVPVFRSCRVLYKHKLLDLDNYKKVIVFKDTFSSPYTVNLLDNLVVNDLLNQKILNVSFTKKNPRKYAESLVTRPHVNAIKLIIDNFEQSNPDVSNDHSSDDVKIYLKLKKLHAKLPNNLAETNRKLNKKEFYQLFDLLLHYKLKRSILAGSPTSDMIDNLIHTSSNRNELMALINYDLFTLKNFEHVIKSNILSFSTLEKMYDNDILCQESLDDIMSASHPRNRAEELIQKSCYQKTNGMKM